jgi:hypothetical protein
MDWLELVLGAIAVILFLVFGIAAAVTVMVSRMARRGIALVPAREQEHPRDFAAMHEVSPWAHAQGFELLGCWVAQLTGPSFIAAWKHHSRPTYLCMYGIQHVYAYEFVSVFAGDYVLTTANTPDSQLLPRPDGYYLQSFNKISLDELLTRHAAAELFLMQQGRLIAEPIDARFEDQIQAALARQMAYVKTVPLWWMKGSYWFLIRKDRLHNKTIEELHHLGKAHLPHELKFKPFAAR